MQVLSLQRPRATPAPLPVDSEIGQWPYMPRGENPIFNFDGGDPKDNKLMDTFPDLVTELNDMSNAVNDQAKIFKVYVKAFQQCSQC